MVLRMSDGVKRESQCVIVGQTGAGTIRRGNGEGLWGRNPNCVLQIRSVGITTHFILYFNLLIPEWNSWSLIHYSNLIISLTQFLSKAGWVAKL